MKIGYPCINRTIDCTCSSTFRLKSYSKKNLIEKIDGNLDCLKRILEFNVDYGIYFFRISSDLVPFASHDIIDYDWAEHFQSRFAEIGRFIINNDIRISMHPDQFIVLNSKKEDVYQRSVKELLYHCQVLNLLGIDSTAKIQLHVGGVYGEREKSKERFVERYLDLDQEIRNRLVIENDDKSYTVEDCLDLNEKTGVPILFDYFHHGLNNRGMELTAVLDEVSNTWGKKDGKPMYDYSSQMPGERKGRHTEHIDVDDFKRFLEESKNHEFDLMLEIKDKEKSAIEASNIIKKSGLRRVRK
ncbi:MAG: UV DNA damage repair endonuclease UvsE [Thermoplasmata archaeon]